MATTDEAPAPDRVFECEVAPDGDAVRLIPKGEIDLDTVSELKQQIDELYATGYARLVLDLRALSFMDSTGLRLILEVDAAARSDGISFELIAGPPAIQRVFDLCGVSSRLPFRTP